MGTKRFVLLCLFFIGIFTFCLAPIGEAKVKLPVLVSDGMVLQRDVPLKIWGWADAGEKVEVQFLKKNYSTVADAQGNWIITLNATKAGGPYSMNVNDAVINDILIGDVWLCAGQSNMETTLERVMNDMFTDEILTYENKNIRHIKFQHDFSLTPKNDIRKTEWRPVTSEFVKPMSAVAYFFAKFMYEKTKVPIGLINTAVGGSTAEAWVDEVYLQNYPYLLRDLEICKADGYIEATNKLQKMRNTLYNQELAKGDIGLKENWKNPSYNDRNWEITTLFGNWSTDDFGLVNGTHWFRKNIQIPEHLKGKEAVLRLGNITDADSVFVNGVFVGTTSYQYPPRIYRIPANLIKAGENNITIRLFSNGGRASFVEDKPYKIIFGKEEISLLGEWKHRMGCKMLPLPGGVGFQNKASVLYNGMIAPIKNASFKGVLWYQGESNTGIPNQYYGLVEALIKNWRDLFTQPDLPFIIAQLPNFMRESRNPSDGSWARLREQQRKLAQNIPNVGMTVNIDLGEWNDIHPLNKKDVGYRLMLQAEKFVYGNTNVIADGPIYESKQIVGDKIVLTFRDGTNDFEPVDELKGFAIAGTDNRYQWAKAKIENGKVIVWNDAIINPVNVRYAWADNPGKVNLKNKSGLPASPFQTVYPAINENETGKYAGFDYELWHDTGNVGMTLKENGAFDCSWNKINNALFRTGKKFDSTKTFKQMGKLTMSYDCDYRPDGNSYLCVYGWSVEPLVEFYIVESWGNWRPPGTNAKASINIDGGIYDIYETTRVNQPSIIGNTTFQQYWSVRRTKKTSGDISVSEHFKAWEKGGMKLGKLYELALCVEGYQSKGTAKVNKNEIHIEKK